MQIITSLDWEAGCKAIVGHVEGGGAIQTTMQWYEEYNLKIFLGHGWARFVYFTSNSDSSGLFQGLALLRNVS